MTDLGQSILGATHLRTPQQVDGALRGLEYLGGWEAAGNEAGVAVTPVISIPVREVLIIMGRVIWTGAVVDRVGMQVGATADTVDQTAQYWSRNIISRGTDTGTAGISDGGIFQGASTASATRWALQFTGALDTGTVKSRAFFVSIANVAGFSKLATWSMTRNTDAAGVSGGIMTGTGEYFGADGALPPVVSVRLLTLGAVASIGAESGFGIFGRDFIQ